MIPMKRLTILVLALLLLGALPLVPADTVGADLVITRVSADTPRLGIATELVIAIENKGDADFNNGNGWQLFVGWNGATDADCIMPYTQTTSGSLVQDGGASHANSICYKRFTPGDASGSVKRGIPLEIRIPWTPSTAQASDSRNDATKSGKVVTQIEIITARSDGTPPQSTNNQFAVANIPDNPNADGDLLETKMQIIAPLIRAKPLRDAAPDNNAKVNDPWPSNRVTAPCIVPEETAAKGQNVKACKAMPGTLVPFQYELTNEGNVEESFRGRVIDQSTSDHGNLTERGWQFFFSPNPVRIPGNNGTAVVTVTMFVPDKEKANLHVNIADDSPTPKVTYQWASILVPQVTTTDPNCTGDFCTDPSAPSVIVDIKHGLNLTSNETYGIKVWPRQQATFNVTLNNSGNAADVYSVALNEEEQTINGSWLANVSPTRIAVDMEAQRNSTITVYPPANATRGLYEFDVHAQSVNDVDGTTFRNLTVRADLQQVYGVSSGFVPSIQQVAPADVAKYVLTVKNGGNGPDNATVEVQMPLSWPYIISQNVVHLEPFGEANVYLNLTPPPGTTANTVGPLYVNVTSEGPLDLPFDQHKKAEMAIATTTVKSSPNIAVEAPVTSAFLDPGTNASFDITITNTGNVDSEFTPSVTPSDTSWGRTVEPASVVLAPGGIGNFRVTMRAPGAATVADPPVKFFVSIVATANAAVHRDLTLEGRVSGPDYTVRAIRVNNTDPYSGDHLGVDVDVANVGNKAATRNMTMRLHFVQGGVEKVIGERTFAPSDLLGGRRQTVSFDWDTSGIEGAGVLLARVDVNNDVVEIDESVTSNELTRALTLRTFDLRITAAEGLAGHAGEKVSYSDAPHLFIAEYRGNQPFEPVTITVSSEHGWVDADFATFPLDRLVRGTPTPLPIDVLIPSLAGTASDRLTVRITPTLRPDSVIAASAVTSVIDSDKPRILSVTATPAVARVNENVTFNAFLQDATGISSARAFVVDPSNATTTLTLAPSGDHYTASAAFNAAGHYLVYVEAADGSDQQNVNSSREAPVAFLVSPGSAPLIALAPGQGTTIRTGSPVNVSITDPLGVAKARYTLHGITYDMTRVGSIWQIETTSFEQGFVDLTVTAENIYGVPTTTKFTLTVDNTPPGIRKVTLTPDHPKANQDALLRIETDPKVQTVNVLLRKDGQIVETRAAEKKSQGVFELLLNPSEGEWKLDITATDAAGNAKIDDGAVSFAAKPASPFDFIPGPGLALGIVALAGVALALRRRRA